MKEAGRKESKEQSAFLRGLLKTKAPLLGLILRANVSAPLHLQADQTRPEALPLLTLLKKKSAARPGVSGRFLRSWPRVLACAPEQTEEHPAEHTEEQVEWALDFREPRHRLALLPPELVLQLARWYGLVRHRTEVLSLVKREDVLALRAEVGAEGQLFVLRRSALLAGAAHTGVNTDARAGQDQKLPIAERIRHSGFAALAACLADAPPPVLRLARCAAPPELAALLTKAADISPAAGSSGDISPWSLLRLLLCKEVCPRWNPCFF
jgi:hypothetical protein